MGGVWPSLSLRVVTADQKSTQEVLNVKESIVSFTFSVKISTETLNISIKQAKLF